MTESKTSSEDKASSEERQLSSERKATHFSGKEIQKIPSS